MNDFDRCSRHDDQKINFCISRLHLFLTYGCSKDCAHCWQKKYRQKDCETLSINDASQFIESFETRPLSISLLGGDIFRYGRRNLEMLADRLDALEVPFFVTLRQDLKVTENLEFLSRATFVNVSCELSEDSEIQNTSKVLLDLGSAGIQAHLLVAATPAFLAQPRERISSLLFDELSFSSASIFPVVPERAENAQYGALSRRLLDLYSGRAADFYKLLTISPLSHAFQRKDELVGGPISCRKRLSFSLHPDRQVFLGSMRVGKSLALDRFISQSSQSLSEAAEDLQRRLPEVCVKCPRQDRCLAYFECDSSMILDSEGECRGLRKFYDEIQHLPNAQEMLVSNT